MSNFKKFPQNTIVTPDGDSVHDETADATKVLVVNAAGTSEHIVPGTNAPDLGKAEDSAHTTGDTGVMALAVRRDVPAEMTSASGDYTPPATDKYNRLWQAPELFGQPEIRCDNEGWGQWKRIALQAKFKDSHDINRHFRYGNWAVHLNGGPQASEESWAAVSIPINEIKVSDIVSIAYDWYAQYNGSAHILDIGPNLVFSAYDPTDHSKRVDFNTYAIDNNLFMDDGLANRPVEAGWYRYKMTSTDATERVYWYGNNTGTHDTAPDEGADGYWSQYITDQVFKDWVVYRIQIMIGFWGATRSTGDVWIDAPKINGIPVKWEPSEAEKIEIEKRDASIFGKPTLQANEHAKADWDRGLTSPLDQKGNGWLARLYGGVQTGDDWARVVIPVNEMHIPDFKTALWSYYMTAAQTMGVNIVFNVHDPFDFDNRAEITQLANVAGLEKALGWDAHELNPSTDQFFFYGENTTKTNLTAFDGTPATLYGWDDFVADELFNTWTIYRITLEYGWEASGTFDNVWVAQIEFNGQQIPLGPADGKHRRIVRVSKIVASAGAEGADDVISEHITDGTDWDFDFGGTGYITKAMVVSAANAVTPRLTIFLYSAPPTCNPDDNVASNGPLLADMPYFVGQIDMPAMTDAGTGHSYAIATPSTYGNLPLSFDTSKLYGIVVTKDIVTFGQTLLYVILGADMEDN